MEPREDIHVRPQPKVGAEPMKTVCQRPHCVHQRQQEKNHDIILSLNANEVTGEEADGIAKLIHDCRLFDLMNVPALELDKQLKDTYH
jgi:hypothetical protein